MGIFEASRGMWITFDVFGVVDKVFHNCGLFRSPSGLRSDLFPGRWNRPEDGTVRKMEPSGSAFKNGLRSVFSADKGDAVRPRFAVPMLSGCTCRRYPVGYLAGRPLSDNPPQYSLCPCA